MPSVDLCVVAPNHSLSYRGVPISWKWSLTTHQKPPRIAAWELGRNNLISPVVSSHWKRKETLRVFLSLSSLSMALSVRLWTTIHWLPSSLFAREESRTFRATGLSLHIWLNCRTMWSGARPSVSMLNVSYSDSNYSASVESK